jgi:hypothetical protein
MTSKSGGALFYRGGWRAAWRTFHFIVGKGADRQKFYPARGGAGYVVSYGKHNGKKIYVRLRSPAASRSGHWTIDIQGPTYRYEFKFLP